jgi:transposase-like protein
VTDEPLGYNDEFPNVDLSCLTERQREVVCMRYVSRLSWRAIGRLLGVHHVVAFRHHEKAIARLGGNGRRLFSEGVCRAHR